MSILGTMKAAINLVQECKIEDGHLSCPEEPDSKGGVLSVLDRMLKDPFGTHQDAARGIGTAASGVAVADGGPQNLTQGALLDFFRSIGGNHMESSHGFLGGIFGDAHDDVRTSPDASSNERTLTPTPRNNFTFGLFQ